MAPVRHLPPHPPAEPAPAVLVWGVWPENRQCGIDGSGDTLHDKEENNYRPERHVSICDLSPCKVTEDANGQLPLVCRREGADLNPRQRDNKEASINETPTDETGNPQKPIQTTCTKALLFSPTPAFGFLLSDRFWVHDVFFPIDHQRNEEEGKWPDHFKAEQKDVLPCLVRWFKGQACSGCVFAIFCLEDPCVVAEASVAHED
mmetsp:Transcript_78332/g.155176  ORF Transcript_78332/g.155176 Transcript_78332/m.155176 type:complete len:204 (+) Transcript_78332:1723-2334(+)